MQEERGFKLQGGSFPKNYFILLFFFVSLPIGSKFTVLFIRWIYDSVARIMMCLRFTMVFLSCIICFYLFLCQCFAWDVEIMFLLLSRDIYGLIVYLLFMCRNMNAVFESWICGGYEGKRKAPYLFLFIS